MFPFGLYVQYKFQRNGHFSGSKIHQCVVSTNIADKLVTTRNASSQERPMSWKQNKKILNITKH